MTDFTVDLSQWTAAGDGKVRGTDPTGVYGALTTLQQLTFESGTLGAKAEAEDSFNECFTDSVYSNDQLPVGSTRSVKFVCDTGNEGFTSWGAYHNLAGAAMSTNFQVNNVGGYSAGASSVVVDSGGGGLSQYNTFKFAGHDTIYSKTGAYFATSGTLTFTPSLTDAVADNEEIIGLNNRFEYGEIGVFEYDIYIPTITRLRAGPGWLKTFRADVQGATRSGNVEFLMMPNDGFAIFSELDLSDPGHFSSANVITRDTWMTLRFEIYFHQTEGWYKLYVDNSTNPVVQATNMYTMESGPGSTSHCNLLKFGTNWNNGAPLVLSSITGGTPAVGDIISSDGASGANFAVIMIDYGDDSFAIADYKAVTSITRSGTTATVTFSAAHGISDGESVTFFGADQSEYNGSKSMTLVNSATMTFQVSGSPATPATGTIYAGRNNASPNFGLAVNDTIDNGTWTANCDAAEQVYYVDNVNIYTRAI